MIKSFGILFDLDGTLVDNEHLKAISFSKAIEQLGGQSNPSIYKIVMGMSGAVIRDRFISESGIQVDSNEYFELYKSIYEDLLKSKLEIKPGVFKFLNDIKSAGIKIAIVSGSYRRSVNFIIHSLNLENFLDIVVTGDDVTNKKPNPDCFLLTLRKMNITHETSIVFEDTESGLEAANKANINSLGIRHSFNQSHDFTLAINEYSSFDNDSDNIKKDINFIFSETIL